MPTTRAALFAIVAPPAGGLRLTLASDPPAIVTLPAGPLAAQLAAAADVGEVWELALADDACTVIGARLSAEALPAERVHISLRRPRRRNMTTTL